MTMKDLAKLEWYHDVLETVVVELSRLNMPNDTINKVEDAMHDIEKLIQKECANVNGNQEKSSQA